MQGTRRYQKAAIGLAGCLVLLGAGCSSTDADDKAVQAAGEGSTIAESAVLESVTAEAKPDDGVGTSDSDQIPVQAAGDAGKSGQPIDMCAELAKVDLAAIGYRVYEDPEAVRLVDSANSCPLISVNPDDLGGEAVTVISSEEPWQFDENRVVLNQEISSAQYGHMKVYWLKEDVEGMCGTSIDTGSGWMGVIFSNWFQTPDERCENAINLTEQLYDEIYK